LGLFVAIKNFPGKKALVIILDTLLAIPTVVVGIFVYSLICRNSIFGGMHLLFTPAAMIIGQVILALPIMITFSQSAVSAVDRSALETAITVGAGSAALIKTLIKEARYGIMAAVVAVFGRLIGEVGVAMMLGGNIKGYTRTMTTAIALETSRGEFISGFQLGCVLLALALGVNLTFRFLQAGIDK
ncbi:ABC transporter permease, partial [Candidatus Woesearchaeota archaeon]|nr:ABC transporter permease [Candidatus Woesearchaeota archaeon]